MHKVRGNYSSPTCKRLKIYVEKGKSGQNMTDVSWNSAWHKWCVSEFDPPSKANVLFAGLFLNLTRFWTKLRVLVPCYPDFMENSNMFHQIHLVFGVLTCRSVLCLWNKSAGSLLQPQCHVLLCWGKEILWTRPSSNIMVIREYLALSGQDDHISQINCISHLKSCTYWIWICSSFQESHLNSLVFLGVLQTIDIP